MPDATDTAEQLREVNHHLSTLPFYIGTSRRQVVGIALVVHLNLEHGAVAGYVAADLHGQPHQAGQPHPLAATAIALRGEDRGRVLNEGALDDAGRYPLAGLAPQARYFLHLGAA
jgi:hypothetical protein